MLIYIGADHRGFQLKESLEKFLKDQGYEVVDIGNNEYDENDDYPDWILPAVKAVSRDLENNIESKAIILGGSGQGEAMAANRVPGIRAAVLYNYNEDIIKLSKEHNNANVLSLGARFISEEDAKKSIKLWLDTNFLKEERHQRRIEKIDFKG